MVTVVMAGGQGTRFWPLSRRKKPKQFLEIIGKGPMIVETCARLAHLSKDEEIVLIVGQAHLEEAESLFRGRKVHILAEPVGRNTAPCIGLGALYAEYMGYKGPVAFLPSDHFVRDNDLFVEALKAAGEIAESGAIAILGIAPARPETGYGYVRRGSESLNVKGSKAYLVSEFVEKPGFEEARRYIADKRYYWNAGIFVARPETVLKEMKYLLPKHYNALKGVADAMGTEDFQEQFRKAYEGMEGTSFDNGIMERTSEKVYVVPCECGWSDVGSWASLYEILTSESSNDQNKVEGQAIALNCKRCFVSSRGGRLVSCLGLKDCLVVDTSDAVLVADIESSQKVREIVEILISSGREELL